MRRRTARNGKPTGTIKIETGVPIPKPSFGSVAYYPWASMKPGDSFFVSADEKEARARVCLAGLANKRAKNGERYTARRVNGGVRIWRIK